MDLDDPEAEAPPESSEMRAMESNVPEDHDSGEPVEGVKRQTEIESTYDLKFSPPVYLQRYCRVSGVLAEEIQRDGDGLPRTVLEVGSAECKLFKYLKNVPIVEKVIMMDIDKELLQSHKHSLRPLPVEYLKKRETPLSLEVYAGCVTKVDSRVLNAEPNIYAILAIEIIEHLDPDVGLGFEETLFSTIAPCLIVVTTPNSDYNEAFKLEKGKFRHWDHRFEWSRQEFKEWCDRMCSKYPSYTFKIEGIGPGPPRFAHLGHVSQMAVFRKNVSFVDICKDEISVKMLKLEENHCYELITTEEYPFFKDPAPIGEQILREFKTFLNLFIFTSSYLDELELEEKTEITYPLNFIKDISCMPKVSDVNLIRTVLEGAGYAMKTDENGEVVVVLPVPPREEEDDDDDEDNFYDDAAPFGIGDENPAMGALDIIDDDRDDIDYEDENWT
jgi:hypothetical protein